MTNQMREIPQDEDAEMALLGAMLADETTIDGVRAVVPGPDPFYTPAHRVLYQAILDGQDSGDPMDLVVMQGRLSRGGQLESVGGTEYLIRLVDSFADAANAEHYARAVLDAHRRRELIRLADRLRESAYDPVGPPVEELCADAAAEVEQIAEGATADVVADAADAVAALPEVWIKSKGARIPTGLFDLDAKTGGLECPSVVLIAARPSTGKTSLSLAIALQAIRHAAPVFYASIETTTRKMAERLVAIIGDRSVRALRDSAPSDQATSCSFAARSIPRRMYHISDGLRGIREICAKSRAMVRRCGVRLIIIDHVQIIRPDGRHESRHRELAVIADQLHNLSKRTGACVLALSQLNRQGADQPSLSHLRDSGALEEVADMVILMHREEGRSGNPQETPVVIHVAKNRDGPTWSYTVCFHNPTMRFEERKDDEWTKGSKSDAEPSQPVHKIPVRAMHEDPQEEIPF